MGQVISLQPLALKGRIKLSLISVCHCPYFYCLTVQAQVAAAIQLSVTGEMSVALWTDTAAQKVAPWFSSESLPLSGNRPPERLCLLHP